MKTEQTIYQQLLNNIKFWQWISILEFIVLVILILIVVRLIKKSKKQKEDDIFETTIIKEGKEAVVDMDNVINSMFNSKSLYDNLIRKTHPNRFAPNEELMKVADEITAEITQNKKDYNKLLELKAIAIEKLGITF